MYKAKQLGNSNGLSRGGIECKRESKVQTQSHKSRHTLEFLQQRLSLLEVGRVEALGEPAIDLRQQLAGLSALALALPQATCASTAGTSRRR